jgi:hypothetical protein
LIQTRHRIPEAPLREGQVIVYKVPRPEPLHKLEARRAETLKLHASGEYGLVIVKLFEDIAHGATWRRPTTTPRLVLNEPTSGLDLLVQARLLIFAERSERRMIWVHRDEGMTGRTFVLPAPSVHAARSTAD